MKKLFKWAIMRKFFAICISLFLVCGNIPNTKSQGLELAYTLNDLKQEIAVHKDYKDLDQKAWEAKIEYRDITHRSQKDFDYLIPMYVKKINAMREMQLTEKDTEKLNFLKEKELRLMDKMAVCIKEVELRKAGLVIRTDLHDQANYYIDYVNGNDANDGLAADNDHAWKTITKYTTTTVRTPGDIAYLRANTTWLQGTAAVSINFDEDGADSWIKLIGCDATTNDPWNDDSDVKPIVDFEDAAYYVVISNDSGWWFERMVFTQSAFSSGCIVTSGGSGTLGRAKFVNCDFSDSGASNAELMMVSADSTVYLDGCTFVDAWATTLYVPGGNCILNNCTLNGGAVHQSGYGIQNYGLVYATNCSFGDTTQFSSQVINPVGGNVYLRNCTYTGTLCTTSESMVGNVYFEDVDGTFESHATYQHNGIITRATASPRASGADSYATIAPNAYCLLNKPLIFGDQMSGFAKVWATKDVQINISVYARVGSAWDSALSASEAYATFNYLSNAATAARTEVQSTETIANDTTWTAFTSGNITPLQTGFIYIWFYLAEYEDDTEFVDVDIKPVVN